MGDFPEAEAVDEVDEKVGNQFSSKKYVEKNSDRNQSFYDSIVLERNWVTRCMIGYKLFFQN